MRLVTIVVLGLSALPLGAAEPIMRQDFASSAGGWSAMGTDSSVRAADGALLFNYTVRPGQMSLAYLPVANLPLAEFHSLRFDVRTDVPMPVAIMLAEKKPGGANYDAVVWSSGMEWQTVVLGVSDFAVSDGPKDPIDPDNKLDPDQVETVAILDLGQLFSSAAASSNVPFHVQPHDGPHTISIRAFEISRDSLPVAASDMVDDFRRPMPAWFTPGGASLSQSEGKLTVRYRQLPDQFVAFLRQVASRNYQGSTHLAMDVASDRPAQLVISIAALRVEGKPAVRYNADFFVPGDGQTDHRELALSAFSRDENGPPDPGGRLNPDNIQSITILDVSGESGDNTLTFQNLRLVRR